MIKTLRKMRTDVIDWIVFPRKMCLNANWHLRMWLYCRCSPLLASLVAKSVKNLPAMQMWVWSLSWEDLLEKEMATHFSVLSCEILQTEESGRLQSMGSQRVRHDWATKPPPPQGVRVMGEKQIVWYNWYFIKPSWENYLCIEYCFTELKKYNLPNHCCNKIVLMRKLRLREN